MTKFATLSLLCVLGLSLVGSCGPTESNAEDYTGLKPFSPITKLEKCVAGELYSLNDPESYHFMRAGPNGAIVTEYATYHNDVKFSHPTMEFGNSEAARITKVKTR